MKSRRTNLGASVAEALVAMATFTLVLILALGALDAALKQHLSAESDAGVERNLIQVSSILRSEARCAALIYAQDNDTGIELALSNNFFSRDNAPVVVSYQWNRRDSTLTRTKVLVSGRHGPFLVASSVTDFQYRQIPSLPPQRGAFVRVAVGHVSLRRYVQLTLLPRLVTSQPQQGGYYSSVFWLSFWKGWLKGIKFGFEGG